MEAETKLASDKEPSHLIKPSGTLSGSLLVNWHYPTLTTSNPDYGLVADRTNPCLRMIFAKLNLEDGSEVLTTDSIFRRCEVTDRKNKETDLWRSTHQTFHDWLFSSRKARVALVLGESNTRGFMRRFPDAVPVIVAETKPFGRKACIWIVYEGGSIKRIVIPSYHLESFLYDISPIVAQLMDKMWNLAAAIARLDKVNDSYFT